MQLPALEQIRAEKARRAAERERLRLAQDAEEIRERCKTLAGFVREAWPVLEPTTPYVHGWHIDAISEHLEAIHRKQITRLQVNQPPGTMKSLTASVLFHAWEWGPGEMPGVRYLTTSYKEGYARRDSRKSRDLIQSEWYRTLWPDIELVRDNETDFENTHRGSRLAVPIASLTAGRGNRLIIDDPHSTEQAESDTERDRTTRIFRESATSRLNDPETDAIIVMMHRLHPDDLCGVIEELGLPYVKLVLPMEYHRSLAVVTPFFQDPRKDEGELLCPQRLSREKVEENKIELGSHAYDTQYQQMARARDGARFFSESDLLVDGAPVPMPTHCDTVFGIVDSATKAGKPHDGTAATFYAYSRHPKPQLVVIGWDIVQIEGSLLINWLPGMFSDLEGYARSCGARRGSAGIHIEDKSSGTILLQQARRGGLNVNAIDSKLTSVGKEERAVSVSGYVRKGLVKIARPAYEKVCVYHGRTKNHLIAQVTGFRIGISDQEDDLFDGFVYGISLALGNAEGY